MESVLQLSDSKDQIRALEGIVDEIFNTRSLLNLPSMMNRLCLSGQFSQQVVKRIVVYIAQQFVKVLIDDNFEDTASNFILTIKQQQVGGLHDEADYIAREALFQYYLASNRFKDAALILAGINFESTSFALSNAQKADTYLKCAECCLADDETVDAEVFVNKASFFMNDIADRQLQLRFRATSARVLDSNRKFLEAADRYYELSSATDTGICQEDLLELLGKAITCATLAKAGPRRSRILKLLIKDEKLAHLETMPNYSLLTVILTKMTYDQLLSRDELKNFESILQPHQKVVMSDGFTIPEKAIMEHNLTAVGKIYKNIKISELAVLLGLEANRVEKVVAKMITEDRLKGFIDQTKGMLQFINEDANDPSEIRVRNICDEITLCAEKVKLMKQQV